MDQISHTVFRGRNNEIVLQLLNEDDPLELPNSVNLVELEVTKNQFQPQPGVTVDSSHTFIEYDDDDGTIRMKLGRVDEITALDDGVYEIEVTAFGPENVEGIAFGSFLIYLRDWGGEIESGT
jgi:hypothetical protein